MSFRAPRRRSPTKRQSGSPSKPAAEVKPFGLIASSALASPRKPHGTSEITFLPRRDIYAPGGTLVQPLVPRADIPRTRDQGDTESSISFSPVKPGTAERSHGQKKARQWEKWATQIIPALLAPYLSLLRETNSLREPIGQETPSQCQCPTNVRRIQVACIYFERMYHRTLI